MKNAGFRTAILGAILLTAAAVAAAADNYKVVNAAKDLYFGHISYIEATPEGTDPVVLREGSAGPEQGVLNLPIGPGDTVRTSGDRRCEIQFDTGTVVRLDFATEVRVETILAGSLSGADELSVLTLGCGRVYVMYREYNRREMFQILTPNAAVKMKHNSVALISAASDGTTEAQVRYGRARVLFGPAEKRLADTAVNKGQRLIVLADHQTELAAAIEDTAFELWNKDVNAHFEALHEGLTAIPKPIQNLPPAVFYFAQFYGNQYGEWLWDDLYGYVWRPFTDNGAYPWGWRPYYAGRWSYSGGQMFWVPDEPWGWIPYHLGIWQWDKKHGWVWLPGSMFAPAWVTWDFYFGYASWRPWSLFDWMYPGAWTSGYNIDDFYAGDLYSPFWRMGPTPDGPDRTVVNRRGLKQPSAPGYMPVPGEFAGLVDRITAAYEKGDVRVRDSAAAVPSQLVIVAKEDLRAPAIREKALTLDQVVKRGVPPENGATALPRVTDPRREASRVFRGIDGPAATPRRIAPPGTGPVPRGAATTAPADPSVSIGRAAVQTGVPDRAASTPVRFRDWNPDLRVARQLGVRIEYSSRRNEVRCPELGLSSSDRARPSGRVPRMTSHGISYGPATSVGGFSSGSSNPAGSGPSEASGQAGSTSGRSASERGSASTGGKESKTGGESGKIKN
jgi:hypothetical protein